MVALHAKGQPKWSLLDSDAARGLVIALKSVEVLMVGRKLKCCKGFLIVIAASMLVSCGGAANLCSTNELSRSSSPNGRVDAVVVETDCGATTRKAHKVHLVTSGQEFDDDRFVFLSDRTQGLSVEWEGDHTLILSYLNARIFQFTNFWSSEKLDNHRYEVKIVEAQSK